MLLHEEWLSWRWIVCQTFNIENEIMITLKTVSTGILIVFNTINECIDETKLASSLIGFRFLDLKYFLF